MYSTAAEQQDFINDPVFQENNQTLLLHKQLLEKVARTRRNKRSLDAQTEQEKKRNELCQKRMQEKDCKDQELAERNKKLKERLSHVRAKDAKCLEEEIEQQRKDLKAKRRAGKEKRKQELSKRNKSITRRLRAVKSLVHEYSDKLDDHGIEQERRKSQLEAEQQCREQRFDEKKRKRKIDERNKSIQEDSPLAHSTKDGKSLEDKVERKRNELETKRRSNEEQRKRDIAKENKLFRQRLKEVTSLIQSFNRLDKKLVEEHRRNNLYEKIRSTAEQRSGEMYGQNTRRKERIREATSSKKYHARTEDETKIRKSRLHQKRLDLQRKSFAHKRLKAKSPQGEEAIQQAEEFKSKVTNRVAVLHGNDSKQLSLQVEQRRRELQEQRQKDAEAKQIELKAHRLALRRCYSVRSSIGAKGRVVHEMQLSSEIESTRRTKQEERRAERERRKKELAEKNASMRKLLAEAKGRDQKTLDPNVEHLRS